MQYLWWIFELKEGAKRSQRQKSQNNRFKGDGGSRKKITSQMLIEIVIVTIIVGCMQYYTQYYTTSYTRHSTAEDIDMSYNT